MAVLIEMKADADKWATSKIHPKIPQGFIPINESYLRPPLNKDTRTVKT